MMTYDPRRVMLVYEDVFEVQVVAVERKLFQCAVICVFVLLLAGTQPLHHSDKAVHLFFHLLLPLLEMRDEERRPLHPAIILVHAIARTIPLGLTLLPIPFVTRVRHVPSKRSDFVVAGSDDLIRVEVQPVGRGLALVLELDTGDLALDAGLQVFVCRRPGPTVDLRRVGEFATVGAKEWPGYDRAYVKLGRSCRAVGVMWLLLLC